MADPANTDSALAWRTAGGDNSRRSCLDRKANILATPERRLPARGALQAAPVFDDSGTAFVADMSGTVQAFSRRGGLLWGTALEGGISATPALHATQGRLFVGTHAGRVCALDTANGAVIWQRALPTKSDPRILSDLLFLAGPELVVLSSWGGRFCALAADTGIERSSWDAGISPGSAACADPENNIYCLRAAESKGIEFVRVTAAGAETVLCSVDAGKQGARRALLAAGPAIDLERAVAYFVANLDQGGLLHAWSLKSGKLLWTHPLAASVQASPAILPNGLVVVADLSGFVRGIGPDGSLQYRYASGSEYLLAGGAGEAGGAFFFGDPLGMVHTLNARGSGRIIFEAKRSIQARPAFDPQGRLYVPSTDRNVYVFPVA